jgi:hypothetical protein
MKFKRFYIASAVLFLGSCSVIATALLAPTPSAAPATPNLRQGVTAQHNAEEQGQAVQIVTGDLSQNELYIFAEEAYVPEKVIVENPDAQIAVLGGSEQKAALKVKEFQKTVAVVHEKIAKVKAVATIQAQSDDQKIQAWNGKKIKFSLSAGKQNIQSMMPKAPALNPSFNHLNPSFTQLAAKNSHTLPDVDASIFNAIPVNTPVDSVADSSAPAVPAATMNQAENAISPKAPQPLTMEAKGAKAAQVESTNKLAMNLDSVQAMNAVKIDIIKPLGVQHNKLALNVANVEMEPVHFSHEKLTRAAAPSSHPGILAKQTAKPKVVASKSFTKIVKQLSAPSHAVVNATSSKLAAKTKVHAKIKHAVKSKHKVTAMKPVAHVTAVVAKIEKNLKVKSVAKREHALTENAKKDHTSHSVVHAAQKAKLKSFATKQHREKISTYVFVPKSKAFVKTGKLNILHRPYKAVATNDSAVKAKHAVSPPVRAYHAPTPTKMAAREHALTMLEKQLAQEDEPVVSPSASRRTRYSQDSEESHNKSVEPVRASRYASRSNDTAEPVRSKRGNDRHTSLYNSGSYETASSDRAEKLAKQMRDPGQFAKLMQD